ncbi:MAG: hypothetical protein MUC88_27760 [Planctomycetes bacterium]|nr:hypothetical protein [Planctomycetota bacterium]
MKWTAIPLAALALAGAALAKEPNPGPATPPAAAPRIYQYLPEEMGRPAAVTRAEYLALKMTAYNGRSQRIATRLVSEAIQVSPWPDSLVVTAAVELTERERANYLGDGKFSYPAAELAPMLQEGVDFVEQLTGLYFAGLDKRLLVINLTMKGVLIGSWGGGRLRVLATGR